MNYADLFKGRGLVLVTGVMGDGKSHFCVTAIRALLNDYPDHQVFTDITGMVEPDLVANPLPNVHKADDDWRNHPDNSITFYDEAQLRDYFTNSNQRINSDERVQHLTLIRKSNKDIVLISQDSGFLHPAIRKLVKTHYHCSNPYDDPNKTNIYYFTKPQTSFDTEGRWRKNIVQKYTHDLDKSVFDLYKSIKPTAKHSKKKRYPKKIIMMFAGAGLGILLALTLAFFGIRWAMSSLSGVKEATQADSTTNVPSNQNTNKTPQQASVIEIRHIYHERLADVEPYFDQAVYNEDLRPAMVISSGTSCKAFNSYGERLNLSQKRCWDMSTDPSLIPRTRQKPDTKLVTEEEKQKQQNNDIPSII